MKLNYMNCFAKTILFTMNEEILERVGKHDPTYEIDADDDEENLASSIDLTQRPSTATDETSNKVRLSTNDKVNFLKDKLCWELEFGGN